MKEKDILLWYLFNNNSKIAFNGKSEFLENKLLKFLPKLIGFEKPDMYAKNGNDVLIIEHFEFDGSKETKKGMKGIKVEARGKKIYSECKKNIESDGLDVLNYSQKSNDYLINFDKHFNSHYRKIDVYKENLIENNIIDDDSKIFVGFFIENKMPPLYYDEKYKTTEVILPLVKQFIDIFEKSCNLDFVLFGGLIEQKDRLIYIDKGMINAYRGKEIDLSEIDILNEVRYSNFVELNMII